MDLLQHQFDRLSKSSSSKETLPPSPQEHKHEGQDDDSTVLLSLPTLDTVLNSSTAYLTYLPFAGLTNQFIGLESAALAAKRLNRTLILPPIISNTHDHDNTHRSWSHFFDLARFSDLTGIPVLEWDQIRPLTKQQLDVGLEQTVFGLHAGYHKEEKTWSKFAENLTTVIVNGYGGWGVNINISGWTFAWHFLLRPILEKPLDEKPDAPQFERPIPNDPRKGDLAVLEDLVYRYKDWKPSGGDGKNINLLTLSNSFKLRDSGFGNRIWKEIGLNIHFLPKVMEFATQRINDEVHGDKGVEVMVNDDPEENEDKQEEATPNDVSDKYDQIQLPTTRIPYIAVHLRRGDIWKKCSEKDVQRCMVPIERYVEAVNKAHTMAATQLGYGEDKDNTTGHHLPVVVTTDTTDEADFAVIKANGWHRLDHARYNTVDVFGSFGPALVDAAILAHADVLVGSKASTMSKIATMRQKDWYHHDSLYPEAVVKRADTVATNPGKQGEDRPSHQRRRAFQGLNRLP